MNVIDNQIVSMVFKNEQFESAIKQSLGSLAKLKLGLEFNKSKEQIQQLGDSVKNFSFNAMETGIQGLQAKFSALSVVGFTVIQNLTNEAMKFAQKITGFVLDPLIQGGKNRALNIEQAKFQFQGLGMDIEASMASALAAVKGTAYGVDAAAKAASQLGASGLRAGDDMTSALRAIAGVASMTGASYEDISNIFTTVAGQGKLMTEQLNMMAYRGLNGAKALGDAMGYTEAEIREMVSKGKISFEDFYKAMDKAFGAQSTKANDKYTGSLSNLRAAFSRIGAQYFGDQLIRHRDIFNALTPKVDGFHAAIKPLIEEFNRLARISTDGLIKMIGGLDFKGILGAAPDFIWTMRNIYGLVTSIGQAIGSAFKEFFPGTSYEKIKQVAEFLRVLSERISMSDRALFNLRNTFRGLFAVLAMVGEGIGFVIGFIVDLFKKIPSTDGKILEFTGNLGLLLVEFQKSGKATEIFATAFEYLSKSVDIVLEKFSVAKDRTGNFVSFIVEAFITLSKGIQQFVEDVKAMDFSRFSLGEIFENLAKRLQPFAALFDGVINFFKRLKDLVVETFPWLLDFGKFIGDIFAKIGEAIKGFTKDFGVDGLRDALNLSFLALIAVQLSNFLGVLKDFASGGKLLDSITGTLDAVKSSLATWQEQIKAQIILQIAGALLMLSGAVLILSLIEPEKLTKALAAITVMFGQMAGTFAIFSKILKTVDVKSLTAVIGSMIAMAIALNLMAVAVAQLSALSWEELAKGLLGITGIIGALILAVKGFEGHEKGLMSASISMGLLAVAINILARAVAYLGQMDLVQLTQGLIGLTAIMGVLILAVKGFEGHEKGLISASVSMTVLGAALHILIAAIEKLGTMDIMVLIQGIGALVPILGILIGTVKLLEGHQKGLISAGVSITILSASLLIMSEALARLGALDLETIGRGTLAMAASLITMSVALKIIGKASSTKNAVALTIVTASLLILAEAMKKLGGMSWEEIGKGLTVLAASLTLLAVAMIFMSNTLTGAAAMIVAAGALVILANAMTILGKLSWEEIGKGLVTIAAAFTILGLAALILQPVIPAIFLLSAAIALIGVGALAAGIGMLALAAGLSAIAVAGPAAGLGLVVLVSGLISLIPMVLQEVARGMVLFAQVIAQSAPAIVAAFTTLLLALLSAIKTVTPALVSTFILLIASLIQALDKLIPMMLATAIKFILMIVQAISTTSSAIINALIELIRKLFQAIRVLADEFLDTAVFFIMKLLLAINIVGPQVIRTIGNLISALINEIAVRVPEFTNKGMDMVIAILNGIANRIGELINAGVNIIINFLEGIARESYRLTNAGADTVISILNSIAYTIDSRSGELRAAGGRIAIAVADGVSGGLFSKLSDVGAAAWSLGRQIIDSISSAVKTNSPSKEAKWIAEDVDRGLIVGLGSLSDDVGSAATDVGGVILSSLAETMNNISDIMDSELNLSPTIKPVVDMSNLNRSVDDINSLFPNNMLASSALAGASQIGMFSGQDIQQAFGKDPTSVQFVQNNYSPESLSRLDIYRDTKNLLSMVKGGTR